MNILTGQITALEVNGNLTLVTAKVDNVVFKSIVIETPQSASYLEVGREIKLLFKETEVIIASGTISNISLQNRITGSVSQIEKGTLLSRLTVRTPVGDIVSIITTKSVEQLKLMKGVKVTAMIKTNEITLSE